MDESGVMYGEWKRMGNYAAFVDRNDNVVCVVKPGENKNYFPYRRIKKTGEWVHEPVTLPTLRVGLRRGNWKIA